MRGQIILVLLLLFFSECKRADNEKVAPAAVKGVIDLRNWDFEKDGMVAFEGEWEFYWNELIENPEEQKTFFKNFDPKKIDFIPVPSLWGEHEINGIKLPPDGYAMYRLRVLLPSNDIPLLYYMTDVWSALSIFVNGELKFSSGKVGKSKVESIPEPRYGIFEIEKKKHSN